MRSIARRTTTMELKLDFSSKALSKASLAAYSAEIDAGLKRNDWSYTTLARKAKVDAWTIGMHCRGYVKNPHVRTMFSVLFAPGWDEITVVKGGVCHSMRKAA